MPQVRDLRIVVDGAVVGIGVVDVVGDRAFPLLLVVVRGAKGLGVLGVVLRVLRKVVRVLH